MLALTERDEMAGKKTSHGGPRKGAGRPSKGRDDMAVKVARDIVLKAKSIAHDRGMTVAEYLSSKLDVPVSHDYAKMLRKNEEKKE